MTLLQSLVVLAGCSARVAGAVLQPRRGATCCHGGASNSKSGGIKYGACTWSCVWAAGPTGRRLVLQLLLGVTTIWL